MNKMGNKLNKFYLGISPMNNQNEGSAQLGVKQLKKSGYGLKHQDSIFVRILKKKKKLKQNQMGKEIDTRGEQKRQNSLILGGQERN